MTEVVMFTRPDCKYCVKAKQLFMTKPFANVELIVLDDQDNYEQVKSWMIEHSEGSKTVPQIFIGGAHVVGGYTGLSILNEAGELDRILQEKRDKTLAIEIEVKRVELA